jgi:hypothetical protein
MPASGPQPDRSVPCAEAADQGDAGDGDGLDCSTIWLSSDPQHLGAVDRRLAPVATRCYETDDIGVPGRTLLTDAKTFALTV